MPSVNGIHTWNYFGFDFGNHIKGATGTALKAVATKFSTATPNI